MPPHLLPHPMLTASSLERRWRMGPGGEGVEGMGWGRGLAGRRGQVVSRQRSSPCPPPQHPVLPLSNAPKWAEYRFGTQGSQVSVQTPCLGLSSACGTVCVQIPPMSLGFPFWIRGHGDLLSAGQRRATVAGARAVRTLALTSLKLFHSRLAAGQWWNRGSPQL